MKLVITEVNDYIIAGELHGHTSGDMTPMLVAHVAETFLFSTQIDLEKKKEGVYSFKKVMGKNETTPYRFWKVLPSDIDLLLSVEDEEAIVNKSSSGKFSHDALFLNKLKDGYVIVQGGGFRKPLHESPNKINDLLRLANEKSKIFKDLFGIDLWLSHGNLLGLMRDGGFMPHEKDVDMSYVSTQPTLKKFKEEYKFIIKKLHENNQRISFWRPNGTLRKFPMWHDDNNGKLLFDLFPAWIDPVKNKLIGQKTVYCDCSYEEFFPMIEEEVNGYGFFVPKCYISYLSGTYGHNWRKVDNLYRGRKRPKEEVVALKSILLSDDEIMSMHPAIFDKYLTSPNFNSFYSFKSLSEKVSSGATSHDILYQVAKTFERDGDYKVALAMLKKIVSLWPENMLYQNELKSLMEKNS